MDYCTNTTLKAMRGLLCKHTTVKDMHGLLYKHNFKKEETVAITIIN